MHPLGYTQFIADKEFETLLFKQSQFCFLGFFFFEGC